jgi:hypothetical protein
MIGMACVGKRDPFQCQWEAFHGGDLALRHHWHEASRRHRGIRAENDASDTTRNFIAHTAQGLENAASRLSLTP